MQPCGDFVTLQFSQGFVTRFREKIDNSANVAICDISEVSLRGLRHLMLDVELPDQAKITL
jgi:hypothetical protein